MEGEKPATISMGSASLRDLFARTGKPSGPEWLSLLRADQQKRWRRGETPWVEAYLEHDSSLDADAILDLIYNEVVVREEIGQSAPCDEYVRRFPQFADSLRRQFALHQMLESDSLLGDTGGAARSSELPTLKKEPAGQGLPPTLDAIPAPRPKIPGYEFIEILGRGGMGIVYKCRQLKPSRAVAVKMILAGEFAAAEQRQRFLSETEMVARLEHPHIVRIYEVGEIDNRPFCSLEYVGGGSLASQLDGTPWPAAKTAELLEVLALAIHHAHRCGIVHRDLKPANILLMPDGQPKITDFGLAKRLDDDSGPTRSGVIVGTPSYMAPEQAEGKNKDLGPAADIYALGAICYELLTGRPPFKAETPLDTVIQVIVSEPVAPSRLNPKTSPDLETICLKCLAKEPAKRYASADDLARDLRRFCNGEPIAARPVGRLERSSKWARRHRAATGLIALVAFVVLVGMPVLAWLWWSAEDAHRNLQRSYKKLAVESYRNSLTSADRGWNVAYDPLHAREALAQCPWELRHWEWYYLDRLFRGGLRTFGGPSDTVAAVAFAPNGGQFALANEDGRVSIWQANAVHEAAALRAPPGVVRLAFSADGTRLITLSRNDKRNELCHWDVATGRELSRSKVTAAEVILSADGLRTIAIDDGPVARLGSLEAREVTRSLQGHKLPVLGAAFSNDGVWAATISGANRRGSESVLGVSSRDAKRKTGDKVPTAAPEPGEIKLWKLATAEVHSLVGSTASVLAVAFSPNGQWLAAAGWDQTVRLWKVPDGREPHPLTEHSDIIGTVAFSPTSEHVLSVDASNRLKVTDVVSRKICIDVQGKADAALRWAFRPDGREIVLANLAGLHAGEIQIHDIKSGQALRSLRGHTEAIVDLSFRADGRRLLSASRDGAAHLWDAVSQQEARALSSAGDEIAFHPEGRRLIGGADDGSLPMWDLASGDILHSFRGHTASLRAVACSRDGRWLASSARDIGEPGEVILWHASTGKWHSKLPDQPGVNRLAFSPEGQRLAMPTDNHAIDIWSIDGKRLKTLVGHQDWVSGLAFPSDRLISASWDGSLRFWHAGLGHEVRRIDVFGKGIETLAVTRDGTRAAVAERAGDRSVVLLDIAAGREIWRNQAPVAITSLALTADGQRLALGDVEGDIHIWDAAQGAALLRLRGHKHAVRNLVFDGNDQTLASLGADGTIRIWDATPSR